MTVQTETSRSGPYAGSGTTGPFTVGFRFLDNSHLQVIRTSTTGVDTTLAITTDYTVSGAGGASGTVTLATALATGERLTIIRDVPFTQLADYVDNDSFPAESHENALDLLTMQTQQNREVLDRSLTFPATVAGVSTELPSPESNKLISWNEAADALQNIDTTMLATVVAYGTAASDLFDGDGTTTQFTLSSSPGALNNLDVSVGGVTQRPGVDYAWSAGTTVTFVAAPPVGTDNVLVRYMQALPQGAADAAAVAYISPMGGVTNLQELAASGGTALVGHLPSGTGAVVTTAQQQLRNIQGWMINVQDAPYYAAGNGSTDDYAAIQAAIDAAPSGATINLPGKNYLITQRLSIPVGSGITLQGSTQYSTAILCVGCSGIIVNATSGFQIKNLEIAAAVRHTTTPNAYIGIEVTGSTGTRPSNHVYRDVLIDGFETSFKSAWLWSSVFDNFRANACLRGIWARNLSVNNVVNNCAFTSSGLASSVGIFLDGSTDPSEGWMISDTLIDSFSQGISGDAVTHVYINNCIIDHNLNYGVLITSSGANFGGNWTVRGNYIAMSGAAGAAAIESLNTVTNSQNRGNVITGNHLLAYAGSTCLRGIEMGGGAAINNIISGNTIKNFSTQDIRTVTGPDIVTDNKCQSAIALNLIVSGSSIVKNNTGVLNFAEFAQYETLGQNKVTWSYSIPTTGTWTQGDICYKSNTVASGFIGWVCVTGGTPGTWKTFGAISA